MASSRSALRAGAATTTRATPSRSSAEAAARVDASPRVAGVAPVVWLVGIIVAALLLRVIGLSWGTPYHHFHIDEYFVLNMADVMGKDFLHASDQPKFFMYGPLPSYVLIALRWLYETVTHPLDLSVVRDEVTFYVLARSISAAAGAATVAFVYAIARRVTDATAGVIAAALMAFSVLHLRESHFFSVDVSMTAFATLTTLFLLDVVETGRWRSYVGAGLACGCALLCKYTALFLFLVMAVAYLAAPGRPAARRPIELGAWLRWTLKGLVAPAIAALVFLALYPQVWLNPQKFRDDVFQWVLTPLAGTWRPIWVAQFADIHPLTYWFTNILWWGIGPAFMAWSIAGIGWLLWRRDRQALVAAMLPIACLLAVSRTTTPYARYGVALVPGLAIAAGVLSADLLRNPQRRLRIVAGVATAFVVGTTALYALAYMRVYLQPDSRLAASLFLQEHVPAGAAVLVEPSQNTPPMGRYLTHPVFGADYVPWGPDTVRDNYFRTVTLDTYGFLYSPNIRARDKQTYIGERLALVDYIVMDDTYVQFYAHLPASEHAVVKQYYDDLLHGRLGFQIVQTFKTYPGLYGVNINDDAAELTFKLFDHPRVYVLKRTTPR